MLRSLIRFIAITPFTLFLFGAPPTTAYSDESPKPKIHILKLDPHYPIPPGATTDAPTQTPTVLKPTKSLLPDAERKKKWFTEAGLNEVIQSWDGVDRDVLILRAQNLPAEKLNQHYPKLDPRNLARLRSAATDAK